MTATYRPRLPRARPTQVRGRGNTLIVCSPGGDSFTLWKPEGELVELLVWYQF